ncbi:hypothetical protein [Meiothermus ruber]|uniref:Uncharacterized protein n=1 Tax=Meiothermus ruber (strain ATCC 35948 / DSM 1279 / VKM B-1258 / 21) TaxID=504728 RepID=D3PT67_MEIRD|nr:hypothetical protein [Meiothermus ruber]ADD28650.1 hypothetical protein Mrub_1893 [Meiothermus ruber DSM 1279]AGK05905.1 hypothetical protein K649_13095 [Meiothermus ruber DSM 1279]MCL6530220.1 hypothetical protein [Meiothermus ruber]GAO75611.1 putative uncharacterized protein [Meiothermus ruber H328]
MKPRLDQVLVWLEQGRAAVQVEYFDALGRLRRETFHRPTRDLGQALEEVAHLLADEGMQGRPRVRRKQGSGLRVEPGLQERFWKALGS